MKISIDGYEVDIKVKGEFSSRANKADTMSFLNTLSIWAAEAAKRYETVGCYALVKGAEKASNDIYNALDALGLYDDVV